MNSLWVSGLWVVAVLVVVLLVVGWRLSWMATRLDRAHSRAERAWSALDVALVRRAHRAQQLAADPRLAPEAALALAAAATAALEPDLAQKDREVRESVLSEALSHSGLAGGEIEQQRAGLARRLHNDAVTTAIGLRRRRTVIWFRLAGHAEEPRSFEMADFLRPTPPYPESSGCTEPPPEPTRVSSVDGEAHANR